MDANPACGTVAIVDPSGSEPLAELVAQGGCEQMQTLDQHLAALVGAGTVDTREALATASDPHDLTVELRARGRLG